MDPIALVAIPGIVGGAVIALLLFRLGKSSAGHELPADAFRRQPLSTDIINMAHIRVAGLGGLGLVVVALVVAVTIPRIGQSLAAGLVLGGVFAAALILWRQQKGPMPSSGQRTGANTTLSIDEPAGDVRHSDRSSDALTEKLDPALAASR
jgi:hypothetical protein